MKYADFNETLYRELQDMEFAQAYLEASLEESVDEFLIALRKFVQAQGGMNRCAQASGLTRESLYKMLTEKGNPALRSVESILKAYGLGLEVRSLVPAKEAEQAGVSIGVGAGITLPPVLQEELARLAASQDMTVEELARMILTSGVTAMQAGRSFLSRTGASRRSPSASALPDEKAVV